MKIHLTNPLTGRSRVARASLTDRHIACRYGQPVLLVDGEPMDITNVVLQGVRIIEPPKRANQVRMLAHWQRNAQAMLGIYPS